MTKNIISLVLLIISALLSFKHGWDAFQPANADQARMLTDLGFSKTIMPYLGILSILVGTMLLFPQTFFICNVLNAIIILLVMAFSLRTGNIKIALLEIPFLAMPLLLIWLKYPFKDQLAK